MESLLALARETFVWLTGQGLYSGCSWLPKPKLLPSTALKLSNSGAFLGTTLKHKMTISLGSPSAFTFA